MYIILVLVLENTVRPQTSRIHPLGPEIQTLVDRGIQQAKLKRCRVQELEKIRSDQNWAPNWCFFYEFTENDWLVVSNMNFIVFYFPFHIWNNHPI
jgi:hypothetical protein